MSSVLDEYCGSTFWNDSYVNRPDPDFPVCLEQTVLVWIPLGFLWICAPWQIPPLFRPRQRGSRFSKLYLIKQALACLLWLTSVIGLIITLFEDFGNNGDPTPNKLNPLVLYVNPSIYTATWMMMLLIHESRRRANDRNSPYLFIFWLLSILCGVFMLQTLIRLAMKEISYPPVSLLNASVTSMSTPN
ncbi:canalicular multispecific organic anion transporter 1 [Scyliorhinus canicula]|uniref:canalicular multispecific organic anion transporter 1 n=1 Tax=Scyliorhinus canicula TaxID=7830 RepID=UPI0018F2CBA3|nr:canalicular multispecific organic anion transporter 1 [Scyliorhinus canicula]